MKRITVFGVLVGANLDLVKDISSAKNLVCEKCLLPMKTVVHMPTQKVVSWCSRCENKTRLSHADFKALMNVNEDGYREARLQYKQEWQE